MHDMTFDDYPLKVARTLVVPTKTPNICKCFDRVKFPETVYVIASGPNGARPALDIPDDAFTIACNSAILMPRDFKWWIAFDHRIVQYGWWKSLNVHTTNLFSGRLVNRLAMNPPVRQISPQYYFEYLPDIVSPTRLNPKFVPTPASEMLMPSILRGGLTVAGIGIQLAYYAGAKNIVLCGVDMTGRGHWDGFTNPDKYDLCAGRWPWANQLQKFCDLLTSKGTRIWTLSDTALNLPRWEIL